MPRPFITARWRFSRRLVALARVTVRRPIADPSRQTIDGFATRADQAEARTDSLRARVDVLQRERDTARAEVEEAAAELCRGRAAGEGASGAAQGRVAGEVAPLPVGPAVSFVSFVMCGQNAVGAHEEPTKVRRGALGAVRAAGRAGFCTASQALHHVPGSARCLSPLWHPGEGTGLSLFKNGR